MSDTNLPASHPDPEGFLADPTTAVHLNGLKVLADKYAIPIKVSEFKEGLSQLTNGPAISTSQAGGHGSSSAKKQHALKDDLFAEYDMIFIRSSDSVYIRKTGETDDTPADPSSLCYRVVQDRDLSNMIRTAYKKRSWLLTGREVEETIRTIKKEIMNERQYVDNGSVQVSNNLFWDAGMGRLRNIGEEMRGEPLSLALGVDGEDTIEEVQEAMRGKLTSLCFRRMFDTSHSSRHTIKWGPDKMAEWEKLEPEIVETYNLALDHLNRSGGRMRIPSDPNNKSDPLTKIYFQFVMDWADGDIDTYEDMMRAFASMFLSAEKKPVGSYFLIGNSRNGKTTFNDLIRTILGENNCSAARMDDFGNWHVARDLLPAFANLPDEDSKVGSKSSDLKLMFANFKTAADHGEIIMDRMASQERFRINCDFMSFFPMNDYPQWDKAESSAEACIRRCWPIFFTHDFSAEDAKTTNFARDTFIPKILAPFVGTVLALASYHSSHPLEKSQTMQAHNDLIENETSSASVYRELFLNHFSGFESQELLWRDYMLYCEDHEYKYSKRADFMRFVNTMVVVEKDANGKVKRPVAVLPDKTRVNYYKLKTWTPDNHSVLHRGLVVPGVSLPGGAPVSLYEYQGGDWGEKNTPPPNGHSVLTAIENEELRKQHPVETNPDQIPPPKPKTSIDWVKEHNKARADKEV